MGREVCGNHRVYAEAARCLQRPLHLHIVWRGPRSLSRIFIRLEISYT